MNEELQVRVDRLYDDLMTVIKAFADRRDEPLIEDSIYMAVIAKIKTLDPTVLNEICPEIKIKPCPEGESISIYYHRIH